MHYNQRWWQSIQENGLVIGDVRNDEGSQAELGWLGQQEGNTLAGTQEMVDGLRKSILFKTDSGFILCYCSFYTVWLSTLWGRKLSLAVCLDNT